MNGQDSLTAIIFSLKFAIPLFAFNTLSFIFFAKLVSDSVLSRELLLLLIFLKKLVKLLETLIKESLNNFAFVRVALSLLKTKVSFISLPKSPCPFLI